jgi:hypothetical protein
MILLDVLVGFLLGAAVPGFLLWTTKKENRHLLNLLLQKEKLRTLDKPFEGVSEVRTPSAPYKDRRSRPTAIDVLVNQAIEDDTNETLHQMGIQPQ